MSDPLKTTPPPDDRGADGGLRVGASAPPGGSSHAGVEAPTSAASRRWLWIALAAVFAVIVLFLLLSAGADTGAAR